MIVKEKVCGYSKEKEITFTWRKENQERLHEGERI